MRLTVFLVGTSREFERSWSKLAFGTGENQTYGTVLLHVNGRLTAY